MEHFITAEKNANQGSLPEYGLVRRGHDDSLDCTVGLAVLDRGDDLLHEREAEGVGGRTVEADNGDAAGGVLLGRDHGRRHPQLAVPGAVTQEGGGRGG